MRVRRIGRQLLQSVEQEENNEYRNSSDPDPRGFHSRPGRWNSAVPSKLHSLRMCAEAEAAYGEEKVPLAEIGPTSPPYEASAPAWLFSY